MGAVCWCLPKPAAALAAASACQPAPKTQQKTNHKTITTTTSSGTGAGLTPADEEWFRLIHVTIEAQAAPALAALPAGQQAAAVGDVATVRHTLDTITAALVAMQVCSMLDAARSGHNTLVPEHCGFSCQDSPQFT